MWRHCMLMLVGAALVGGCADQQQAAAPPDGTQLCRQVTEAAAAADDDRAAALLLRAASRRDTEAERKITGLVRLLTGAVSVLSDGGSLRLQELLEPPRADGFATTVERWANANGTSVYIGCTVGYGLSADGGHQLGLAVDTDPAKLRQRLEETHRSVRRKVSPVAI